jgi:acetate kinase
MGMTPIEGLIMGTRTGDLDIGAFLQIINKEELDISVANTLVNKHSGMLGVSGVSSDMRDVEKAAEEGNKRAKVTLEMYYYRIKKYIGSYAAAMGGVDVIVLQVELVRMILQHVCLPPRIWNLWVLSSTNQRIKDCGGKEAIISADDSKVKGNGCSYKRRACDCT